MIKWLNGLCAGSEEICCIKWLIDGTLCLQDPKKDDVLHDWFIYLQDPKKDTVLHD